MKMPDGARADGLAMADQPRRSGGNLRAVQEHLRHADIQTTTVYTRLTQSDLQKVIGAFDINPGDGNRDSRPIPHGT